MASSEPQPTPAESHYNQLKNQGIQERTKSRIFHLRNFNNWIKSQLLGDVFSRLGQDWSEERNDIRILDLCCGKGGDIKKYKRIRDQASIRHKRLRIGHVIFSDIAEVSLEQAESRFREDVGRERFDDRKFTAEFLHADATRVDLRSQFRQPDIGLDLTSQQFSLHYGFESEAQARRMLSNAVANLRPGGYYVGTIPHYARIVKVLRESDGEFSNEVCSIRLESKAMLADDVPPALFGQTYHFTLDEQVNCPEYLLYFPLLEKLLAELDMSLVWCKSFDQLLNETGQAGPGLELLRRMTALETYPAEELSAGDTEKEYGSASAKWDGLKAGDSEPTGKLGCLSQSEWQVACLYLAFMFKKNAAAK